MMRLSLIVVEEPDFFQHKQCNFFDSLAAQTYPHHAFELLLVESQGRDSTMRGFEQFRLAYPEIAAARLQCPSTSRAAGNNLAASRADGDLLVFLADDFDPSPGFLAAHAEYHTWNSDTNAVGIGAGLFAEEARQDAFIRWLEDSGQIFGVPMRAVQAVWPTGYFYAGNASIKSEKFAALGGFDERFLNDAWDDFEFGLRWDASGGYSQFIAGAYATHRHMVGFEERCYVLEAAGRAARVLEQLHPARHHAWLDKIRRPGTPICDAIQEDTPMHIRIAFYEHTMDAAFRRGYLGASSQ